MFKNEKSKRICQKLIISLLETYPELHISTYIMNIFFKVVSMSTNTIHHEQIIVSRIKTQLIMYNVMIVYYIIQEVSVHDSKYQGRP